MAQKKKLTTTEEENLKAWQNRHFCGYSDYTLNFSNEAGQGVKVEVQCYCGERKDVTDYLSK